MRPISRSARAPGTARRPSITTVQGAACREACAAPSDSPGWMPTARRGSPPRATAGRSPGCCPSSVRSRPVSPPITCPDRLSTAGPCPISTPACRARLGRNLCRGARYALGRAASEEQAALTRVVAEDARAASWMAAAGFFNTIAHRAGLFQAAAHNVPAVALPPPSLERWAPAADAAVKGLAAALARSREYNPMLFSAATAGSRRAARTGRRWRKRRHGQRADGVHRPRQRHRRRQRQSHRRSCRPRPWPDQRGAGRHGRADGRRRRVRPARIHSLHRQVGSMSSNPSGRSPTVSSRPCSASC